MEGVRDEAGGGNAAGAKGPEQIAAQAGGAEHGEETAEIESLQKGLSKDALRIAQLLSVSPDVVNISVNVG